MFEKRECRVVASKIVVPSAEEVKDESKVFVTLDAGNVVGRVLINNALSTAEEERLIEWVEKELNSDLWRQYQGRGIDPATGNKEVTASGTVERVDVAEVAYKLEGEADLLARLFDDTMPYAKMVLEVLRERVHDILDKADAREDDDEDAVAKNSPVTNGTISDKALAHDRESGGPLSASERLATVREFLREHWDRPEALQVTKYYADKDSGLAQHFDSRACYGAIATASLRHPCTLVMQRKNTKFFQESRLLLHPRSIYVLTGPSRGDCTDPDDTTRNHARCPCCWTHGIQAMAKGTFSHRFDCSPEARALRRVGITIRSLTPGAKDRARRESGIRGEGKRPVVVVDRGQASLMNARTTLWSLPNTAFGIGMGVGGNAILWRTISDTRFTDKVLGHEGNWAFWVVGLAIWCVLLVLLVAKVVCYPRFASREWHHPTRCYFFFAPHLALVMLAIATPASLETRLRAARTSAWLVSCVLQVGLALVVYTRWMFSPVDGDVGHASPPYLLSTVGWPLLCVLAQILDLERRWNFDLPSCLFGIGAVWYALAFIAIMHTMHEHQHNKGAPVLFLIVAPPSVMAVALANFNDGAFGRASSAVFGFCVFMLLLLLRLGPKLLARPETLGVYWAYVFPLAALATASIRFASTYDTQVARILAWILVGVSTAAIITVSCRMSVHIYAVATGRAFWNDPLMDRALDAAAASSSGKPRRCDGLIFFRSPCACLFVAASSLRGRAASSEKEENHASILEDKIVVPHDPTKDDDSPPTPAGWSTCLA
ncbi:hypothetical protein CTAYLR_002790 [Chrysophaeum taylorii]|uniref:Alpha-ketoglutarate-dependent dioxygenase AlkB-like domain-containing protein n=1 Tax=Chrysophaeum taylorii TaxID=2483200 RepID=A0AAD7XHT5_9STRA|nr:hypothetical protein CTAYLR_002790 [Chrysophaeum taylorii]